MVDVDKVINSLSLKPTSFKLEKNEVNKLNEIVANIILQCEDLIKHYTNNDFKNKPIPHAVENICLRLVSNMITFSIQRRDSPIIKVNDWKIQTISSEIFTEDLKSDLEPFIIEHSNKSDKVEFYAITGD